MLLIVASTSFAVGRYQWKLVDTEDGCQIYTSVVAGKDYIASKTNCVIPSKYNKLVEDAVETGFVKS